MQRQGARTGIVGGGVIAEGVDSDDLERRIGERSEQLYRIRLMQRLLLLWAYPGNLVLAVIPVAAVFLLTPASTPTLVVCLLIPVVSIGVSGRLLYRQHLAVRAAESELRALRRAHREQLLDGIGTGDLLAAHKRYRADLPEIIEGYRAESRTCHQRNNLVQFLVIAGSIATSASAVASVSLAEFRWVAVLLSLVVAFAAALGSHAKYRERRVSLQQTADALEREYHSVELRVGRYKDFDDEWSAYAAFADEVELLRDHQAKRQLQLGEAVRTGVVDVIAG